MSCRLAGKIQQQRGLTDPTFVWQLRSYCPVRRASRHSRLERRNFSRLLGRSTQESRHFQKWTDHIYRRCARRSQHALPREQNAETCVEDEIILDIEAANTADIHTSNLTEEGQVEQNTYGEITAQAIEVITTSGSGKFETSSDRLLHVVEKYLPHAIPTVQWRDVTQQEDGDESTEDEQTLRLEIENNIYELYCSHDIVISQQTQDSLTNVLEDLVNQYLQQLTIYLMNHNVPESHTKSYPTRMLYQLLDLNHITTNHGIIEADAAAPGKLLLHQAEVCSANNVLLGPRQFWTKSNVAKRLARASAKAALLERAAEAGIDLDAARCDLATQGINFFDQPPTTKRQPFLELPRVSPEAKKVYHASISQDCLSAIFYTLSELHRVDLRDIVPLQPFKTLARPPPHPTTRITYSPELSALSHRMKERAVNEVVSDSRRMILAQSNKLPIRVPSTRTRICDMVEQNDVLVLVSETGSGKTTQVPQILLEAAIHSGRGAWCNIVCTQPRRIAATSVASRVAQERGTLVGDSVGYKVRFDHNLATKPGSINYVTAGAFLKQLQDEPDVTLTNTSHIIVDEVHERDLTVDLLMATLRDLMLRSNSNRRRFPKLLLMSATMKSIDFEQYFAESSTEFTPRVSSLRIPGRAYTVTCNMLDEIVPTFLELYADDGPMMSLLKNSHEYLEWEDQFAEANSSLSDVPLTKAAAVSEALETSESQSTLSDPWRDSIVPNSLIIATITHILRIDTQGDILIFLPGMKEIEELANALASKAMVQMDFRNTDKVRVYKLHSALYETNSRVFEPIPRDCRRIILSTNIAQTSITLPNVVHVIDSGKQRKLLFDQVSRRSEFTSVWIDQSTSHQRRGRAGRVQDGHYWAMFTNARLHAAAEWATPEILASDLTSAGLVVKSLSNDIDLRQFFARTLNAPDPSIVDACIQELKSLGTLTPDEEITALGKFCADLPLHPAKARGLLLGIIFKLFQPLLIVACHDSNSPLIQTSSARKDMYQAALTFVGAADDDRYTFVQAFFEYDRAVEKKDRSAIAALESRHVKRDAYEAMLRVARQLYEMLERYRLVQLPDGKRSLIRGGRYGMFGVEGHHYNMRKPSITLFKALAIGMVYTNLAVWDEGEQSFLAKDIKCIVRPYSVNTKQSLEILDRTPTRKDGELVAFSEMLRNVTSSPKPFLGETSCVTPLIAMLFGGPITLIDDNTIEIDGWLRYQIHLETMVEEGVPKAATAAKTTSAGAAAVAEFSSLNSPAVAILEFRKAIDRFLNLSFTILRKRPKTTEEGDDDDNSIPKTNHDSYRKKIQTAMVDGLNMVLKADEQHWESWLHNSNNNNRIKDDDKAFQQ